MVYQTTQGQNPVVTVLKEAVLASLMLTLVAFPLVVLAFFGWLGIQLGEGINAYTISQGNTPPEDWKFMPLPILFGLFCGYGVLKRFDLGLFPVRYPKEPQTKITYPKGYETPTETLIMQPWQRLIALWKNSVVIDILFNTIAVNLIIAGFFALFVASPIAITIVCLLSTPFVDGLFVYTPFPFSYACVSCAVVLLYLLIDPRLRYFWYWRKSRLDTLKQPKPRKTHRI